MIVEQLATYKDFVLIVGCLFLVPFVFAVLYFLYKYVSNFLAFRKLEKGD